MFKPQIARRPQLEKRSSSNSNCQFLIQKVNSRWSSVFCGLKCPMEKKVQLRCLRAVTAPFSLVFRHHIVVIHADIVTKALSRLCVATCTIVAKLENCLDDIGQVRASSRSESYIKAKPVGQNHSYVR